MNKICQNFKVLKYNTTDFKGKTEYIVYFLGCVTICCKKKLYFKFK